MADAYRVASSVGRSGTFAEQTYRDNALTLVCWLLFDVEASYISGVPVNGYSGLHPRLNGRSLHDPALSREVQLAALVRRMYAEMQHANDGAWENGVYDSSAGDEGEVLHSRFMDDVEEVFKALTGERLRV